MRISAHIFVRQKKNNALHDPVSWQKKVQKSISISREIENSGLTKARK